MRKTKKLISLLLAVLLAAACVTGTAAFSASAKASTFTLEATSNALFPTKTSTYKDITTYADDNGDIYVTVEYSICAPGKQLINFQIHRIQWDPNVLQFDSAVNTVKIGRNPILNIHPIVTNQNFSYIANLDYIDQGYIVSNFSDVSNTNRAYAYNVDDNNNPIPDSIVKVIFKVIDPTVTKTTVNLDMSVLSLDDETAHEPYARYVVIDDGFVDPAYNDIIDVDTQLSPEGDVIDIIGDVNLDGNVDVLDATYVQKYSSDKTTLSERQKYVGDVNNDGNVDVLDAADIQKYSADKISEFKKK